MNTILMVVLLLVLLGGVGFIPAPAFTQNQRIIAGSVIFVLFIFWILKYSPIHVF